VITAVGTWAADLESRRRGTEDPGPVVVDEVAGQLLTYLVALPVASLAGLREQLAVVGGGFFLFRFFDIVKPWPANRLERLPGGLGIMADDLAAAAYAGLGLAITSWWLHGS
jgi:phosphatidylglycerophosphatase A